VNTQHELQNFVKNLGIFAGLLLLAAINMEQVADSDKAQ
jgi:putative oxidoreductase